jgi:hypothetical protein
MSRLTACAMAAFLAAAPAALAQPLGAIAGAPLQSSTVSMVGRTLYDEAGKPLGKIDDIVSSTDGHGEFVVVRGAEDEQLVSVNDIIDKAGHMVLRAGAQMVPPF